MNDVLKKKKLKLSECDLTLVILALLVTNLHI